MTRFFCKKSMDALSLCDKEANLLQLDWLKQILFYIEKV